MSVVDRIKSLLGTMSQREFAERIGLSAQAVNQWFQGHAEPKPKTLKVIADKFGVDVNWLMTGQTWEASAPPAAGNFKPPPEILGERNLPVYVAVEGGKGELLVSTDPIEFVQRPWYLGEVRDGYAVVVTGESMVPVYDPGDMVIINPRLPHMRGKDHIFVGGSEDGSYRATVKRLIRATETSWIVEQFNPPGELTLPRANWTEAKRIVGKYVG
jgi:phage repressor protein C with HTH and peptisase S24 domain